MGSIQDTTMAAVTSCENHQREPRNTYRTFVLKGKQVTSVYENYISHPGGTPLERLEYPYMDR